MTAEGSVDRGMILAPPCSGQASEMNSCGQDARHTAGLDIPAGNPRCYVPREAQETASLASDHSSSPEIVRCELAAQVLRSFGRLRLRANGASMLPAIWPGDILCVRSHNASAALPGEIVLYKREGRLFAHRVVKRTLHKNSVQWVTRGDSLDANDPPISGHELLGRVTAINRGNRRVHPRLTFWRNIGASILSRCDFCTRVLLHLRYAPSENRTFCSP